MSLMLFKKAILTPSFSQALISAGLAGISCKDLRYTIVTSSIIRTKDLAQSIATFPPPQTIAFLYFLKSSCLWLMFKS